MSKIDIDKFVADILNYYEEECGGLPHRIMQALNKQGLEYKNGKIIKSCDGCNNTKGCVTCTDGDQWAFIVDPDLKGTDQDGGVKVERGEQGLTEFENRLVGALDYARRHRRDVTDEALICDAKAISKELLAIARKEFLYKACRWVGNIHDGAYLRDDDCGYTDIHWTEFIKDFRSVMEE